MAVWIDFCEHRTIWGSKFQNATATAFSNLGPLYEDIGCHRRLQAITFLGNRQSFKHCVTLWNFSTGVNRIIVKCAIS